VARAATPAIAALVSAGVAHEVLAYHHDPRNQSFGDEAVDELARTMGIQPGQVFKTLVLALPKGLAVAVLPVPSKLLLKAAAAWSIHESAERQYALRTIEDEMFKQPWAVDELKAYVCGCCGHVLWFA